LETPLVTPAPGQLLYYGGPIVSNPTVISVNWNSQVAPRIQQYMAPFFDALGNSELWRLIASEYGTRRNANAGSHAGNSGTQQDINSMGSAATYTLTQPTLQLLHDSDVQAALRGSFGGSLPQPTGDTLYIVNMPPGTTLISQEGFVSCAPGRGWGFCGYHDYFNLITGVVVNYAVVMDTSVDCAGICGTAADYLDNATNVASHELFEMVTDPEDQPSNDYPQAWRTANGTEVGDLCSSQEGILRTLKPDGTHWVAQKEYDNVNGGCFTPCTPITCEAVGAYCRTIDDQCGGTLNCTCPGGLVCYNGACVSPPPPPPPPPSCTPEACMQGCRDCNGSTGHCVGDSCVCSSKRSCF
jgi:hypothetical protein